MSLVFDVTQRLVDFAFRPMDEVEVWLQCFPYLTVKHIEQNGLHVIHDSGFACGIVGGHPIDQGIAIASAVLGPFWSSIVPDLIDRIDAEWHRRKKVQPKPEPAMIAAAVSVVAPAQGRLL